MKSTIFYPEFNIKLYDKNFESDYYFFLPPKSEFFFNNIANQNNFLGKKHTPPPFKLNGRSPRPTKNRCVSVCIVFNIRVGRCRFFLTCKYMYTLSSKIAPTCFFLSYYSLLIIWHAYWFKTSIKCTRKRRKLLKSETNTEMETNFRILPIYFFFGIKNVRVGRSIGNTPNFLDMMNKTMYSDY